MAKLEPIVVDVDTSEVDAAIRRLRAMHRIAVSDRWWQAYLAALPAALAHFCAYSDVSDEWVSASAAKLASACADAAIAAFERHLDDEQARAAALGAAEQLDAGSGDAEREAGEAAGGGHG